MTTKFNKDMYAKMKSKKDEPLSSIEKKGVHVIGKGPSAIPVASVTPIISGAETVRTTSLAISVEEILTPSLKRQRISGKEKEKADSLSSTVWGYQGLAVDRAHGVVTVEDLKVFDGVPFNVVANQQVHKLVQVICTCAFGIYPSFTNDVSFLFMCWGRVFTLLLSTSLRRLRWHH